MKKIFLEADPNQVEIKKLLGKDVLMCVWRRQKQPQETDELAQKTGKAGKEGEMKK